MPPSTMATPTSPSPRPNRFKPTLVHAFPKDKGAKEGADAIFWKSLQFPVSVQESGQINYVDVCEAKPHLVAVTGSAKIQVYSPAFSSSSSSSQEPVKTFSKFRERSHGGRLRRDGRLLAAGGDDGAVRLFNLATKTQLRIFQGHSRATRRTDFTSDLRRLASFSDDRTVSIWDIAANERICNFSGHKDYVRAGCASSLTSSLVASGSYDHTVRLWDQRQQGGAGGSQVLCVDHGSPVEAVAFMPNESLLVSAGGHEVRVWDLVSGGRQLFRLTPHNKTVTWLGFANGRRRLVTASLDAQLRFHDITNFSTVHQIRFPSPILSAAVAPDDSFVIAGMSDGLVQFLHRKELQTEEEKRTEMLAKPRFGYMRYSDFRAAPGDIVVKQHAMPKEARHDSHLRRFEHSRALDAALRPFVQKRSPETTHAVLGELRRRGALRAALAGRDERGLAPILNFVGRHVGDPRFSELAIEVAGEILDLYSESLGQQPNFQRLFVELRKRVDWESRSLGQLLQLKGAVDLVLCASRSQEKPQLRSEEMALKRTMAEESRVVEGEEELGLSLQKILGE